MAASKGDEQKDGDPKAGDPKASETTFRDRVEDLIADVKANIERYRNRWPHLTAENAEEVVRGAIGSFELPSYSVVPDNVAEHPTEAPDAFGKPDAGSATAPAVANSPKQVEVEKQG